MSFDLSELPGALPRDEWRPYREKLRQIGKEPIRRCPYCQRWMARTAETLDHIHPRCLGGNNDPRNIVVVCSDCNHRKADQTPIQLLRWAARVLYVAIVKSLGEEGGLT